MNWVIALLVTFECEVSILEVEQSVKVKSAQYKQGRIMDRELDSVTEWIHSGPTSDTYWPCEPGQVS